MKPKRFLGLAHDRKLDHQNKSLEFHFRLYLSHDTYVSYKSEQHSSSKIYHYSFQWIVRLQEIVILIHDLPVLDMTSKPPRIAYNSDELFFHNDAFAFFPPVINLHSLDGHTNIIKTPFSQPCMEFPEILLPMIDLYGLIYNFWVDIQLVYYQLIDNTSVRITLNINTGQFCQSNPCCVLCELPPLAK